MDPFALALDAIFAAPGSFDATYAPLDGFRSPIRVIRSQPDQLERYAGTQFLQGTNVFEIRVSDVAKPAIGDRILFDTPPDPQWESEYIVSLPPIGDTEGLSWTCVTEPSE